jgi:hypothetical protein
MDEVGLVTGGTIDGRNGRAPDPPRIELIERLLLPAPAGDRVMRFAAPHMSAPVPIATASHVLRNVGDQGKCGHVVLNVSFVARDPKRPSGGRRRRSLRR